MRNREEIRSVIENKEAMQYLFSICGAEFKYANLLHVCESIVCENEN